MKVIAEVIVVEHFFAVSVEQLWRAITQVEEMKKWFFENIPAFQPVVGFTTTFDVDSGERVFPHVWTIIEVIPFKKIVYKWEYRNYKGEARVSFEFIENREGVVLRLTNKVVDDFTADIPEFKRESCLGGWNYFIKNRLTNYFSE